MALSDLSSTAAVLSAIEEFDRLGQERFLELYGFAAAREYLLLFKGRKYDSKAIAGVAHKYRFYAFTPKKDRNPPVVRSIAWYRESYAVHALKYRLQEMRFGCGVSLEERAKELAWARAKAADGSKSWPRCGSKLSGEEKGSSGFSATCPPMNIAR
jgi:hypothetical protein